jgi:hypothetical protein
MTVQAGTSRSVLQPALVWPTAAHALDEQLLDSVNTLSLKIIAYFYVMSKKNNISGRSSPA